ncbi:hypothetical protein NDU88_000087 [Pleurodeles waltl]|uniref:Uncharacterized protein n=1 Tax=Pleurodeles waltl TaxID=8319 RepID=A0AAV7U2M6_PLEWA|nr:hypothetical protein NDU88_000087 [Pleurodeles waltl]
MPQDPSRTRPVNATGPEQDAPGARPGQEQDAPGARPGQEQDAPGARPGQEQDAPGARPGQEQDAPGACPGQEQACVPLPRPEEAGLGRPMTRTVIENLPCAPTLGKSQRAIVVIHLALWANVRVLETLGLPQPTSIGAMLGRATEIASTELAVTERRPPPECDWCQGHREGCDALPLPSDGHWCGIFRAHTLGPSESERRCSVPGTFSSCDD